MSKYSFLADYSEGCHPNILQALADSNLIQQPAYGQDIYCQQAIQRIRTLCKSPDAAVHFVSGGTIANIVTLGCGLRPYEAVIAADSGHIAVREAGAIEATGHKVITAPAQNGKLKAQDIHRIMEINDAAPHQPKARLVYISNATELGTLYSKSELTSLSAACKDHNLWLALDGARMAAALAARDNDLTLSDIAELTDIFWIGGTKAGALIGEAIVIPNPDLARDFGRHMTQRGAVLAKGRLLGIQFDELLKDDLMFDLARHANAMAQKLAQAISAAGYDFAIPACTNQLFPIFPEAVIAPLQQEFDFYVWEQRPENHATVRIVTSWATDEAQVDRFIASLTGA